jgi:enoyl-CoA hydratase/carnithine racemase
MVHHIYNSSSYERNRNEKFRQHVPETSPRFHLVSRTILILLGAKRETVGYSVTPHFAIEHAPEARILRLTSPDLTNRLTRACVEALTDAIRKLASEPRPVILTGNQHFFSAGADLHEIAALTAPAAFEFSKLGQALMNFIADFPAPVYAAIHGYCMGGGLDLALACHHRIAAPNAIFGHRGAALGLITGWGGTQRLPRLIGKARALQMLLAAEKLHAPEALQVGLLDAIVQDPVAASLARVNTAARP